MTTAPQPPSVLVVDDDVDTCRNLSDILTDLGYRVDTATGGPAALDLLRGRAYDVALLDFKMPAMTGLELYRELKKVRPGTVAIIVSAYTDRQVQAEALEAGAWQVLSKPVDFPRLLGLVDEAVRQPLVLVVDDDQDLCATLWDLFRDRGYRVCLAHDAQSAADRLKDQAYRVVLVDLRLPDQDGSVVVRAVRAASPDARTVVITGYPQELDGAVGQAVREGADAVCYKPLDVAHLLSTLGRLAGPAGPGPGGG